jgi:hypothetical protein
VQDTESHSWAEVWRVLERAAGFWLSMAGAGGRPHVTPLVAVVVDEVVYFCPPAGAAAERFAGRPRCILTAGTAGDVEAVVEGRAEPVHDDVLLKEVAGAYLAKYGPDWAFIVREGALHHGSRRAVVFAIAPSAGFAFNATAGSGRPRPG